MRANTIYRSGELSRLSDADLAIISGLDIRLVCDLRTDQEQAEFSSRWPENTGHIYLDMPGRDKSDAGPNRFFELIAAHPGDSGALIAMDTLYRRKPQVLAKSLHVLFAAILAGNALPVLIHCHAGKDRTGYIVAILLAAVGVSKEDILDDYSATALYFRPEEESGFFKTWAKEAFSIDLDPLALRPLVDARRDYIEAAFEEITKGWGGVDAYLAQEAGLNDDARAQLQAALLLT